jgi:hypothetical protein
MGMRAVRPDGCPAGRRWCERFGGGREVRPPRATRATPSCGPYPALPATHRHGRSVTQWSNVASSTGLPAAGCRVLAAGWCTSDPPPNPKPPITQPPQLPPPNNPVQALGSAHGLPISGFVYQPQSTMTYPR